MTSADATLYFGLSELFMKEQRFELGLGVRIRIAYAHMFANYMLAYTPALEGAPHPEPWKAARGRTWHDITAELAIPAEGIETYGTAQEIAKAVVLVVRLGVNPATSIAATSNRQFYAQSQTSDADAWVQPEETEVRRFALAVENGVVDETRAAWIAERWPIAARLTRESPEFALAVDALNIGQYVHRSSLTMIAIWGALEAIFSPSTSELRFRVSALIASFLEVPGEGRRARAKAVAKLYDKRSSAAHGKASHGDDDLLASFNLLGETLNKVLDMKRMPSKDELELLLYGSPPVSPPP